MTNLEQQRLTAIALSRLKKLKITSCFDPVDPTSRPTKEQERVFKDINSTQFRYVTGGNQTGKSQLGAREVAWVFSETHPHWKRSPDWGDEPLLLLVLGRTTKQIEETLWKKIQAFLEPADFSVQRIGGVVQKVIHRPTGNTILFLSHHNDNEAREKAQSYVAHYVWLDEMPGSPKLIEELHRRIQARRGRFLATFTPKVVNHEIKRLVEAAKAPHASKYRLKAFDNPIYTTEDKDKLIASLASFSESYRRTILEGDWMVGEESVYSWDPEYMVEDPPNYHPSWRHVESVDPALQSKFGYTLWAENPSTGVWYLVRADYIKNIPVPDDMVLECLLRTEGKNTVKRVSDPHESWFINTASAKGIHYTLPYDKNSRKGELIKGLQTALSTGVAKIASWCDDFMDEVSTCQWSERAANKIVNSSKYHLLDSAQYFIDCMPKPERDYIQKTWYQELREGNHKRKKAERAERKANKISRGRIRRRIGAWR